MELVGVAVVQPLQIALALAHTLDRLARDRLGLVLHYHLQQLYILNHTPTYSQTNTNTHSHTIGMPDVTSQRSASLRGERPSWSDCVGLAAQHIARRNCDLELMASTMEMVRQVSSGLTTPARPAR